MWYIWKSLAILSHTGLFQIQEALCRWTTAERILWRNFAYHPFPRSVTITEALSTLTPSKVGGLKRRPPPSLRLWRRRTRALVSLTRLSKAGGHSGQPTDTVERLKRREPGADRWLWRVFTFPLLRSLTVARWRRVCAGTEDRGSSIRPHGLPSESSPSLSSLSNREDDCCCEDRQNFFWKKGKLDCWTFGLLDFHRSQGLAFLYFVIEDDCSRDWPLDLCVAKCILEKHRNNTLWKLRICPNRNGDFYNGAYHFKIREVVKKLYFYGQADHKDWLLPHPLTVSFSCFLAWVKP